MEQSSGRGRPFSLAVPSEYRPLHKYLSDRFADAVVLSFVQIEDLLGFPLPDLARRQPEWWADGAAAGVVSAQSACWTEANRTASPNLRAMTVTFDRTRL